MFGYALKEVHKMTALLGFFGGVVTWIGTQIAARWGFKLALIAAVTSTFLIMWGVLLAVLFGLSNLLPDSGFTPFLLQFFPSSHAIATAFTIFYGSMLSKMSWDFWIQTFSLSVMIGSK